ncbi:ribonuclease HI [Rhizobium sp. BK275]|uniref:ribonuclease H family protein n=1 Tax=unclassified Rhizobium TaxID=2613769 RepID=UPI00161BD82E|nr:MULTISPECIES: ribonuclease H [unclassified Rhizobium]MBB3391814.1 ribonuclease HI [Rhizobium sp. BK275]MBB3410220.1 ribonuclease HI [Rhizobium sp. BK316]
MTDISDESCTCETSAEIPDTQQGLHVFVDGCFDPGAGHGGWAFVAYRDGVEIASGFGGARDSSNNAMEVTAVLEAAIWINGTATGVAAVIWSDSAYAVEGCNSRRAIWRNNGWKKSNPTGKARNRAISDAKIWKAVDIQLSENSLISIVWCKGHSGTDGNERADALADQGRRSIRRA